MPQRNEVHQRPDGWIRVLTSDLIYIGKPDEFKLDFPDITLPPLPEGAEERIYTPGVRHAIQNSETIIAGGPMPWPLGDKIIKLIEAALASQSKRREEEKERIKALLMEKADEE